MNSTNQVDAALLSVQKANEAVIYAQNTGELQLYQEAQQQLQLAQQTVSYINQEIIDETDRREIRLAKEYLRILQQTMQALQ